MPTVARHLSAVNAQRMTNIEGFDLWLRANSCSDQTIHDRVGVVRDFARSHPAFPHVTPWEITAWIGRPNYAPWTRGTYFGHLSSYFRFATQVGYLTANPMDGMRRPKSPKAAPRPLEPEQVAAVLAAANPNMHAWLTLGLKAGLRAHEIAKIRGQDVHAGHLWVLGKGNRGDYLPTHPLIWAEAQRRPRVGWWFPTWGSSGHVSPKTVSTMTSALFASCGITGSVHRARHTFATDLLRAGVNIRTVQELMRHESLVSTQVYLAVSEPERRAAIDLLPAA